jgi:succinyl-diaminopimelate desuccinylase
MSIELLQQLVEIPSTSGDEHTLRDFMLRDLLMMRYVKIASLGHSLAAHFQGTDSSRAFIVSGHLDTVPPTDDWTTDPYQVTPHATESDRVHGLGVTDMKSGLCIARVLTRQAYYHKPPCDLWVAFSHQEETDGLGANLLVPHIASEINHGYDAIGGLILEPTSAASIGVGHRGDTIWDVTAGGPGGHASHDFLSEPTAIEKVGRFIADLPAVRKRWLADFNDPILGNPTINPVELQAGHATNVVPYSATATCNVRATPDLAMALPRVRAELESTYDILINQRTEPTPSVCHRNELIYRAAQNALPGLPFQAFPGATDQGAFHRAGIPMLIYGPGDPRQMHQPDESVSMPAVKRCMGGVIRTIHEFARLDLEAA